MSDLIGSIDSVELGAGFAVVEGWLVSQADGSTPADILIAIDDGAPVEIRERRSRHDLRQAGISTGDAAFRVDLPTDISQAETVKVSLLVPSLSLKVNFADIAVRSFTPRGSIDWANETGVSGWFYDPTTWRGGTPAQLLVEDGTALAVMPELVRSDVSEALGLPARPLGFHLSRPEVMAAVGPAGAGEARDIAVQLVSNGLVLARATLRLPGAVRPQPDASPAEPAPAVRPVSTSARLGHVDGYRDGRLHGWAVDPDAPESPLDLTVEVDGVAYARARAERPRGDLAAKGIAYEAGGFSVPLTHSPTGRPDVDITVRVTGTESWVTEKPYRLRSLPVPQACVDWSRALADLAAARPVVLIVPVYNAPNEVAACLDSLIAHTTVPCRLLIIDDASPDPRVGEVLARFAGLPGVEILRNDVNLGFVQTCNRGFALAEGHDVALLNSDIVVGPRWLENLRLAAYSRPDIGTVTPLSNNAGVFSAPEPNQLNEAPAGWSVADRARLATFAAAGSLPVVPTGNGFCLYIRASCLKVVGGFDAEAFPRGYGEENDLCMRAARAGFVHLMDDRTFVHHERSASFKEEKAANYQAGQAVLHGRYPEYKQLTKRFFTGDAMLAMRWRLRRAVAQHAAPPKPRILFVIATETGGTPLTNADLMAALADRYEPWLLRSNGKRITLSRWRAGTEKAELVESHELSERVEIADHRSQEYSRVVAGMLVRSGVELVHIRHIAWHGLDLPALCRGLSIPVVFSFHDFYAICPTIKLIDSTCQACCLEGRQSEAPCHAELWDRDSVPALKPGFLPRWREMMAQALAPVDVFVTTSPDARRRLVEAYPMLGERDVRIIPHGRDFAQMRPPSDDRMRQGPFRILVPGNISPAKGALLIEAIAALDQGRTLEFHILGESGAMAEAPGLVLHGRYDRETFGERVAAIDPAMGVVFSRWPETYCHTLTEMWACGLPVFATRLGAVAERIERHGGGWLHDSRMEPREVRRQLLISLTDDEDYQRKLADVAAWQGGYGRDYGCAMMAAFYDGLYRQQLASRNVFTPADRRSAAQFWAHIDETGAGTFADGFSDRHVLVSLQACPDATQPEFTALAGVVWTIASPEEAQRSAERVLAGLGERSLVLDLRGWAQDRIETLPDALLAQADLMLDDENDAASLPGLLDAALSSRQRR